jgi:hypothetical protein
MTCMSYSRILLIFCSAALWAQAPASAPLIISGDIPASVTLTADDIAKMPHETVTIPDQDGTKVDYQGVPLREILQRAGAPLGKELRGKALTTYIVAKAKDGYQVVFTIGEIAPEFGNASILVADQRDGKPLFGYQGPLRLVCPNDKAGARSVRMLEKIEIVRLQK